ncbi:hypothetical protein M406DRAFT_262975, partial [Cryphonectria parasitica EP155]
SCICKPFSIPKSIQDRNLLISRFLKNFIEMLIYSYCKKRSFEFCKISSRNSSCCIKCIHLNCFKCNIMNSFSEKLCNIAIQY